MKRVVAILLILSLWTLLNRFASAETLNFRNYTVKDGLANSTVYYIFQDSRGFIWFATESGVNRFDGQKFELFTMDNGLSDNEVLQIKEDSKGRIWFLTLNGKLSYYQNNKFYNFQNSTLLKKSACPGSFISFFEDSRRQLWFSTNQNRLLRIGRDNKLNIYTPSNISLTNCTVSETGRNTLILGKELLVNFKENHFDEVNTPFRPSSDRAIYKDLSTGAIYFISDHGLVKVEGNKIRLVSRLQNSEAPLTEALLVENTGQLWMGTMGKGLLIYRTPASLPEIQLKDQSITHIMKDHQGNVWISTIGNGVYMFPSYARNFTHFTISDGLSSNAVSCVLKARDQLILGLRNGNLDIIDKEGRISHRIFNAQNAYNPVKKLYFDEKKNCLYYASNNELLVIKQFRTVKILLDKNKTFALKSFSVSRQGKIAIALASGVYIAGNDAPSLFSPPKNFLKLPHFLNRAFTVFFDSAGRLWFSNLQGLQYFEKGKVVRLFQKYPVLQQRITDMSELPDHTIVCTTYGFGVFLIKNNQLIKTLTTRNGLPSNICKKLYLDGNTAWIVTGKGISRIDFTQTSFSIINYDTGTGIISNEVNDIFAKNDTIYVATNNGLSIFRPTVNRLYPAPSLYLRDIHVNRKSLTGTNFVLDYWQNNITVNYIALDFSHPSHLIYNYRLNNDKKWHETTGSSIEFGSIEPGDYTLCIRAKSLNTPWSKPLTLKFLITPPFWKTWWFTTLAALAAATLLLVIVRYYFRQRQAKEKEKLLVKTRIISLEQQALQAMMNPHFIFNVMNSIQYFINTRDHTMANQILTGFARLIRKNLDICNKSYINVEEEINYLNLYLSLEKLRFGDKMNYKIELDEEIDIQETLIPSMLLQPYVENAIWHGIMPKDSPGHINISIQKNKGDLQIRISDDGIGFNNSLAQKKGDHISQGMKLTAQRIALLNKFKTTPIRMDVRPGEPEGTVVTITIPLKPFTNSKGPDTQ